MDPTLLQWIVGQTGMAGLAAFAIWLMDQRHKEGIARTDESMRREIQNVETHRMDKAQLIEVLNKNAEVQTRLIDTLNRVDDRLTQVERYLKD
jgi:hypothetical protein